MSANEPTTEEGLGISLSKSGEEVLDFLFSRVAAPELALGCKARNLGKLNKIVSEWRPRI